jgi:hypothetical protein
LKRALVKAWDEEITLEPLNKIVDDFPKRLNIEAKGGYFEQFLLFCYCFILFVIKFQSVFPV